jgi:uncharacterized membrane protein HdeD (DUF308 family)
MARTPVHQAVELGYPDAADLEAVGWRKEPVMVELTRSWWILAVRGVVAVIFGLLALIWPEITLLALVLVFGAYAFVDGVFALVAAVRGRQLAGGSRAWLVLEGLLGVGAGVVAVLWPDITALALLWVIAVWAVLTGVLEILAAVRLRRVLDNDGLLVVCGGSAGGSRPPSGCRRRRPRSRWPGRRRGSGSAAPRSVAPEGWPRTSVAGRPG